MNPEHESMMHILGVVMVRAWPKLVTVVVATAVLAYLFAHT